MVTCYDCKNNRHDEGDTENGFCLVKEEPIGGINWPMEWFDKYSAHLFPEYAENCKSFKRIKTQIERVWAWVKGN